MREWRQIFAPKELRRVALIILTLIIGIAGAALYSYTDLPLPWFLGAMLACLVALALRAPIESSRRLTRLMRIVLGLAIGSSFSPEMIDRAGEMAISLLFVFPYVIFLAAIGYPYFRMFPGFDRVTAFLAAVPGGFQTMVAIGEDSRCDIRRLSIVHSTRILVIVALVPLWIQLSGSIDLPSAVPVTAHFAELTFQDVLILVACGLVGDWAARRAGISGAAIIGPMLVNGVLHIFGLVETRMPLELVNAAQLVIGVHIGCQFLGLTLRDIVNTVSVAFGYALLLLAAAAAFTALVVWVTGLNEYAVALAYAPGGQPEMNLIALVLNFDPAYVALHHLLRVMVIVLGAQFIISRILKSGSDQSDSEAHRA